MLPSLKPRMAWRDLKAMLLVGRGLTGIASTKRCARVYTCHPCAKLPRLTGVLFRSASGQYRVPPTHAPEVRKARPPRVRTIDVSPRRAKPATYRGRDFQRTSRLGPARGERAPSNPQRTEIA